MAQDAGSGLGDAARALEDGSAAESKAGAASPWYSTHVLARCVPRREVMPNPCRPASEGGGGLETPHSRRFVTSLHWLRMCTNAPERIPGSPAQPIAARAAPILTSGVRPLSRMRA